MDATHWIGICSPTVCLRFAWSWRYILWLYPWLCCKVSVLGYWTSNLNQIKWAQKPSTFFCCGCLTLVTWDLICEGAKCSLHVTGAECCKMLNTLKKRDTQRFKIKISKTVSSMISLDSLFCTQNTSSSIGTVWNKKQVDIWEMAVLRFQIPIRTKGKPFSGLKGGPLSHSGSRCLGFPM